MILRWELGEKSPCIYSDFFIDFAAPKLKFWKVGKDLFDMFRGNGSCIEPGYFMPGKIHVFKFKIHVFSFPEMLHAVLGNGTEGAFFPIAEVLQGIN